MKMERRLYFLPLVLDPSYNKEKEQTHKLLKSLHGWKLKYCSRFYDVAKCTTMTHNAYEVILVQGA